MVSDGGGVGVSYEAHAANAREMTVANGGISWTHRDVTIRINGAMLGGVEFTYGGEPCCAESRPLGSYTAEGTIRIRRKSWRRLVRWAMRGAPDAVPLGRIGGRRAYARDLRRWAR